MDILIIDDENSIRLTASLALEAEGHYVETAEDGKLALRRIKEEQFDLVFLDLRPGNEDGLELLRKIIALKQPPLVVIFTACDAIATAVQATRHGAFGYLEKPFTPDELRAVLTRARKSLITRGEAKSLTKSIPESTSEVRRSLSPPLSFSSDDARSRREFEVLFRAAGTPASILLLGESGTGKSVIAREIHGRSHLRDKPFRTVSCPSLSKELLESELFGHVKGSFTGAIKDTWGKIHEADGGTLFLDEIGELPIEIQPKLLHFLQEREYERLGENKVRAANVRIIAATNCDLKASMEAGNFREDLFYRLNVISVTIPPLRQRPADLERIANDYLGYFSAERRRNIKGFSQSGRIALMRHAWPGNLRELRNAIERASILSAGPEITAEDLPQPVSLPSAENGGEHGLLGIGGEHSLEEVEKAHMMEVLRWVPSLSEAAAVFGIDKATLYRKRKRFGLE